MHHAWHRWPLMCSLVSLMPMAACCIIALFFSPTLNNRILLYPHSLAGYCCFAMWCSYCASWSLRKQALHGDMSRYICCNGACPCSGKREKWLFVGEAGRYLPGGDVDWITAKGPPEISHLKHLRTVRWEELPILLPVPRGVLLLCHECCNDEVHDPGRAADPGVWDSSWGRFQVRSGWRNGSDRHLFEYKPCLKGVTMTFKFPPSARIPSEEQLLMSCGLLQL